MPSPTFPLPGHPFYYIGLWSNVTFWQIPPPPYGGDVIYGRPLFHLPHYCSPQS